ncbi:MAG TPA: polyamine aminopropyltransferase [Methylophilaceae bacterium]|nr:polyamine aminopropyltransferase [Methylophilaceae bacterium]
MFRLGARRVHRNVSDDSSVDVSEVDGIRSLHLGTDTVQSSMRIKAPFELELRYTRGMMAFLLFSNTVRNVLAIGLGGGSVPKYLYHHVPEIKTRVIEINPQIIHIARSHFEVPQDDNRFEVVEGDGVLYLRENEAAAQALMIDAFDSRGIPPDLCSQEFFDSCAAALTADGIFAINLWSSDKNFDVYLARIELSFNQRVLVLPTGWPGNMVVFGFRRVPVDLRWSTLRERAKALEVDHKIEFLEFVERLREHNPNTNNRLLMEA